MTNRSIAHRTMIGATWMVAWRMVTRVLGVASTLVLARILVPADFGVVAMATTFLAAIDALSQLGLQDALVRRPEDDRSLFDAAFTLQAGRALVTGAIVAGAAPLAGWWFGEPRLLPVVLVLAALAVVGGFENIGIVEFRRDLRFDRQFLLLAAPRLLQVAVTVPLAFALQNYWALLLGIAASKLARVAATYVAHPYRPRLGLSGWRALAGFSSWTWATSAANVVWERCDPVVLGPVLGPAGLGQYLLAQELATLPVSELIAPAADALFAGFASAQKRGVDLARAAPSVAVALLLIVMPVTIAVSATAGYLVAALLGPKWAAAQELVAILAWQCLFSPFSYVFSSVLVAGGRVRLNFLANLLAAALRLVALLAAIALTGRLTDVALLVTVVVGVEAVVYTVILVRAGVLAFQGLGGGLARILLAGAATTAMLGASGLGWRVVAMPSLPALLQGGLIGGLALACFATVTGLGWLVAGKPAGVETQIAGLAGQFVNIGAWRKRLRLA